MRLERPVKQIGFSPVLRCVVPVLGRTDWC